MKKKLHFNLQTFCNIWVQRQTPGCFYCFHFLSSNNPYQLFRHQPIPWTKWHYNFRCWSYSYTIHIHTSILSSQCLADGLAPAGSLLMSSLDILSAKLLEKLIITNKVLTFFKWHYLTRKMRTLGMLIQEPITLQLINLFQRSESFALSLYKMSELNDIILMHQFL